jgi:hypothetical protein
VGTTTEVLAAVVRNSRVRRVSRCGCGRSVRLHFTSTLVCWGYEAMTATGKVWLFDDAGPDELLDQRRDQIRTEVAKPGRRPSPAAAGHLKRPQVDGAASFSRKATVASAVRRCTTSASTCPLPTSNAASRQHVPRRMYAYSFKTASLQVAGSNTGRRCARPWVRNPGPWC